MVGSAAAMLLARDGHQVTVVDRDGGPGPAGVERAWGGWKRQAVSQFHSPHLLLARGTQVLQTELPDVVDALDAHGALRFNPVALGLARIDPAGLRPEDERFTMVTGRRPMLEWVLGSCLAREPGVTVRRETAIEGLVASPNGVGSVPHVVGLGLAGGEKLTADLVIDATGRRSPTPAWLQAIGARAPLEASEDSGFAYYSRFFRSGDGSVPPFLAPGLTPFGTISVLCIPADNGTWSVTIYALSRDAALRGVRDVAAFERVIRACPAHAHWLEGEAITDIEVMAGVTDRDYRFVVDGAPVATGIATIGDAWACTNPSLGRGMSMGLMHAVLVRDVLREVAGGIGGVGVDPRPLALELDARTHGELGPWHQATRRLDRARATEMGALVAGGEPVPDPVGNIACALQTAAFIDSAALRYQAELQGCLALPSEVFGRPGALDHVLAVAGSGAAPVFPGPVRAQLLELVSAAPG